MGTGWAMGYGKTQQGGQGRNREREGNASVRVSYCSVALLKLFVSAPALASTFKKFPHRRRLRLRLELCGHLFSKLLNEKVDFS
jgi:hypothetical protein